jgi:tight adherence protein B
VNPVLKRAFGLLVSVLALGLGVAGAGSAAPAPPPDFEVMLVIDTSGSMKGQPIELAKQAAYGFVDRLPNVRIGLESFSSNVDVLTVPTTDHDLVKLRIAGLIADGRTRLHDAIMRAPQVFSNATEKRAIVLLSDGGDEGSVASLDLAAVATTGIHVEVISLQTSRSDPAALQRLGTVTAAENPGALAGAFARMADQLPQIVQAAPTTPPTTVPPTTVPPTTTPPTTEPPTTAPAVVAPVPTQPPAQPHETSKLWLWLGLGAAALAIFLIVVIAMPGVKVTRTRLEIREERSMSGPGQRATQAMDDLLERYGKRRELGQRLAVAGMTTSTGEFATLVVAIAVVLFLLGLALVGPLIGIALAAAAVVVALMIVNQRATKRQAAFAEQLADILKLLTNSLRSGHGLAQALDAVVEEIDDPARIEFERVLTDVRVGRDLNDSMTALADRMDSEDMRWVVAAIAINRETGGNLSEILDTVSETIRERQRAQRQVRTFTAEGRLTARLLTGLPFLLAFWQWRANPDNFEFLTHGVGLVLLCFAGVLLLTGWFWISRIIRIKM